jgi:ribonuclease P protein component
MIPKREKITRSLFNEVFLFGKNKKSIFFRIKKKKTDKSKFSIVVSKKVFKKAVDRNRIKRLFFNTIKDMNFKDGQSSYIFISQKNMKQASDSEIKSDIVDFFKNNQ